MSGHYIEVPACMPVGVPSVLRHDVAGTVRLDLEGHPADAFGTDSAEVAAVKLRGALATAIVEGLDSVSPEQVHIRALHVLVRRRLGPFDEGRSLAGSPPDAESTAAPALEVDFEVRGATSESAAADLAARLGGARFRSSLRSSLEASLPSLDLASVDVTQTLVVAVHAAPASAGTIVAEAEAAATQGSTGAPDASGAQPTKIVLLGAISGTIVFCTAAALATGFCDRCRHGWRPSPKVGQPGSPPRSEWRGTDWQADADDGEGDEGDCGGFTKGDEGLYDRWVKEYNDSIQVLGLPPGAAPTPEGLRQAYRQAALRWHPDRPHNAGVPEASAMFIRSRRAYEFLAQSRRPAAETGL